VPVLILYRYINWCFRIMKVPMKEIAPRFRHDSMVQGLP